MENFKHSIKIPQFLNVDIRQHALFHSGQTVFDPQGVSDGAAAVVVASEDALKEHKLTPLARIVAYHVSGCDPSIMGIGELTLSDEANSVLYLKPVYLNRGSS